MVTKIDLTHGLPDDAARKCLETGRAHLQTSSLVSNPSAAPVVAAISNFLKIKQSVHNKYITMQLIAQEGKRIYFVQFDLN